VIWHCQALRLISSLENSVSQQKLSMLTHLPVGTVRDSLFQQTEAIEAIIASIREAVDPNTSGTNSLPDEIISIIFEEMCCGGLTDNRRFERAKHATVLCAVSRRWRRLAIECTPRIWSGFELHSQTQLYETDLLERLTTFCKRSGICHLDVMIHIGFFQYHPKLHFQRAAQVVIQEVLAFRDRLRSLFLILELEDDRIEMLQQLRDVAVPQLRELDIEFNNPPY
jgi:hypothetical protein